MPTLDIPTLKMPGKLMVSPRKELSACMSPGSEYLVTYVAATEISMPKMPELPDMSKMDSFVPKIPEMPSGDPQKDCKQQ
jgi:hypothetical protein